MSLGSRVTREVGGRRSSYWVRHDSPRDNWSPSAMIKQTWEHAAQLPDPIPLTESSRDAGLEERPRRSFEVRYGKYSLKLVRMEMALSLRKVYSGRATITSSRL